MLGHTHDRRAAQNIKVDIQRGFQRLLTDSGCFPQFWILILNFYDNLYLYKRCLHLGSLMTALASLCLWRFC